MWHAGGRYSACGSVYCLSELLCNMRRVGKGMTSPTGCPCPCPACGPAWQGITACTYADPAQLSVAAAPPGLGACTWGVQKRRAGRSPPPPLLRGPIAGRATWQGGGEAAAEKAAALAVAHCTGAR
eukprot:364630-Chlamydomonas_euryale.AAC.14